VAFHQGSPIDTNPLARPGAGSKSRLARRASIEVSDLISPRDSPYECVRRLELINAVRKAIEALPVRYKHVLFLRDIEELGTQETAARLGLTIQAAKTPLFRARTMLHAAFRGSNVRFEVRGRESSRPLRSKTAARDTKSVTSDAGRLQADNGVQSKDQNALKFGMCSPVISGTLAE
jgi:hypothetical protein